MVPRPHIDLRALIALSLSILLVRSSASAAPSRSPNPEVDTLRKQVEKSRIEAKRANAAHAAAIGRLNTSAGTQAGRINTLEQRISAAADTQSRLTAQSETHSQALQNISQQLNTQIHDRTTVINGVIHESTVGGTIAGAIRDAKDDVTAASVARDNALHGEIQSEAAARTAAVNAESASRTSALATAISSEVNARNTAITTAVDASTQTLQGRIAAEATTRANGDNALSDAVARERTDRTGAIAAEVTNRNSAITAAVNASAQSLLGNIAAEAAARERAVNATNGALTTERNERLSGQQTLTNTANSLRNDLATERDVRIGVDNAHAAAIERTQDGLATEFAQRLAADGAETAARTAAINAREQAITTAYTARMNEEGIVRNNSDSALSARISAEVGNSQARDTALGNTISSTSAQLTTDYRAAISQAIAADIAPEAARITAAITNQAVNPLSATVIPAQIAASRAAITSDYTAAIGQFQSSVISDYGLPPQEITVSAAAPHPGSAVGPTDYYCQMVNLAGYLDDGDRTARLSLTVQKNSINTAANVYLGQADLRSAEVVLHLEDPTFSGRTPDDRRRSASVIVNGANVFSRNLLAGSTYEYFSYLLGANGDTLTTFLGAQVGDGALPFGALSYAQNRKFGVELLSGSTVIARLVNGVPLKPGTTDPNNANNFGCANVSISAADRALVMDHGNIFKDPNVWLLQIRGDYAGNVLISTR